MISFELTRSFFGDGMSVLFRKRLDIKEYAYLKGGNVAILVDSYNSISNFVKQSSSNYLPCYGNSTKVLTAYIFATCKHVSTAVSTSELTPMAIMVGGGGERQLSSCHYTTYHFTYHMRRKTLQVG